MKASNPEWEKSARRLAPQTTDVSGILRRALSELEQQRQTIDRQLAALRTMLDGVLVSAPARRGRRRMSAAQRAAVSKRMKSYWANRRSAASKRAAPKPAKPTWQKAKRTKKKAATSAKKKATTPANE